MKKLLVSRNMQAEILIDSKIPDIVIAVVLVRL